MNGNHGIARLHREVQRAAGLVDRTPTWLELGTVNADLSLTVDHFGMNYPTGSWLTLEHLTAPATLATLTDPQGGTIPLARPAILHPLQSGDRVLVALLHGQADPVVLGRVVAVGTVTP